ncbi:MAG: hypothetical protein IMY73_04235 [Bacteroidetes bacterium]|nr:hypothetical protein [Bacteroidota bacterium]
MKNFVRLLLVVMSMSMCFSCSNYSETDLIQDDLNKKGFVIDENGNKTVTVPFKADFFGTYTNIIFGTDSECDDPYGCRIFVEFVGNATHLGNMTGDFEFCACGPDNKYDASTSKMIAANGDILYVSVKGRVVPGRLDDHPEHVVSYWRDPFVILGGTGKFEGATGEGFTDDYNSSLHPGNTQHNWNGTITIIVGNGKGKKK